MNDEEHRPRLLVFIVAYEAESTIEQVLRRFRLPFEGRALTANELTYEVQMPYEGSTDPVSHGIVALSPRTDMGVVWTDKKPKTK